MSGVALLDVNVLVALFDPDHVHHEAAHDWFANEGTGGWATCPVTENGFIRVITNPAYGLDGLRAEAVAQRSALRGERSSSFLARCRVAAGRRPLRPGGGARLPPAHRPLPARAGGDDERPPRHVRPGIPLKAVAGARREHLAVIGVAA